MRSIQLTKNHVFHACRKHIEIHYHLIREWALVDDINLFHVNTSQRIVNVFPKDLGGVHRDSKQHLAITDQELAEWVNQELAGAS